MNLAHEAALIAEASNPEATADELIERWEWARNSDTIVREAVFVALFKNPATPNALLLDLTVGLLAHHDDLANAVINHPNADRHVLEALLSKRGLSRALGKVTYAKIRASL